MTFAGPAGPPAAGGGGSDDDKSCGFGSTAPVGSPLLWFAAALSLLALLRRRS
jgi:MYXO-CTERM domain-containing protein